MIPLYYTFYSRYKNKFSKIAYIFSSIVPIFVLNFEVNIEKNTLKGMILLFFSILSIMSIYEIGYILNDSLTVKKEINPTLRLSEKERQILENNILMVILEKILISVLIFKLLRMYTDVSWIKYIMSISFLLGIYFLHNNIRRVKINFFTFMGLSFCRFFMPVYLITKNINILFVFLVFLELVLVRNIELIGKKYKLFNINIYQNRDFFRVIYYLVLLLLYDIFKINLQFKILLYYLLGYRFLGYLFVKLKNKEKRFLKKK